MTKNVALYLRRVAIGKLMAIAIASSISAPAMAQDASTMSAAVAAFVESTIRLQSINMEGDPATYREVAAIRSRALADLAFKRPTDLTELANKLAALVEFSEDAERFALRMTVEDALSLRSGAK